MGTSIFSKLKSAAKSAVKGVKSAAKAVGAKVVSTAAKVTSRVAKTVSKVSTAVAKVSKTVSNVAKKVAEVADQVAETYDKIAEDAWQDAKENFASAGKDFKDAVDMTKEVIDKTKCAIKTKISSIKEEITSSKLYSDIINFDINNQDPGKTLDSTYFSAYKGKIVIRMYSDFFTSAGLPGLIILNSKEENDFKGETTLNHEYGHTLQAEQLGGIKYSIFIMAPSMAYNMLDRFYRKNGSGALYENYFNMPWERSADTFLGG